MAQVFSEHGCLRRRVSSRDRAMVSLVISSLFSLKMHRPSLLLALALGGYVQIDQVPKRLDCEDKGGVDDGIRELFDFQGFQGSLHHG